MAKWITFNFLAELEFLGTFPGRNTSVVNAPRLLLSTGYLAWAVLD
jgi:hypothetical protein